MAAERASGDRRARWASAVELAGLAVLSYVPFVLSSPGRVSADSKQYLYLDVDHFLARAPYLWDQQMGAGTVSHQHLGYLFPMGPWFWLMERVGVEVWVAQRLPDVARSGDHIDDAGGVSGVLDEPGQVERRHRCDLGGLDH